REHRGRVDQREALALRNGGRRDVPGMLEADRRIHTGEYLCLQRLFRRAIPGALGQSGPYALGLVLCGVTCTGQRWRRRGKNLGAGHEREWHHTRIEDKRREAIGG